MMKWWPLTFQNQATQNTFMVDWLHDYILILLLFVLMIVGGALILLMKEKLTIFRVSPSQSVEVIWTVIPAIALFFVGVPSLSTLYASEETSSNNMSVKITGHQWYWSYDYLDIENLEFDSFMKMPQDLLMGDFRNLEVDNRLVAPFTTKIIFLITSADVLHSWALPSISLKGDANPGRLNMTLGALEMAGLYYGQCSELCGANHSFMPISVEGVSPSSFLNWVKNSEA